MINAGPVVPPAELVHLNKRFARAKSAAAGVGATLTLTSPVPGKAVGFAAMFQLP